MSNFKIIRALQNYKEYKHYGFYVDGLHYKITIQQNIISKSRKEFLLREFVGTIGSTVVGLIYDTEDFRIYHSSIGTKLIYLDEPIENYDDTELLYHYRHLSDEKLVPNPNLLSKIKDIL